MLLPSITWREIPQVAEQGCCKYFLARCCGNKQYAPSSPPKLQRTSICTFSRAPGRLCLVQKVVEARQSPPLSAAANARTDFFLQHQGAQEELGTGESETSPPSPAVTHPNSATALGSALPVLSQQ